MPRIAKERARPAMRAPETGRQGYGFIKTRHIERMGEYTQW